MPLRMQWAPDQFAGVLAKIRDAMSLSAADLARLAGVSRSQASRWGRGAHQPAYPNVRQLGIAVYRDYPELAQELMASAGYPRLTDDDLAAAAGPLDDLKPWQESWEEPLAADEGLPVETRRWFIEDSRRARIAQEERKRSRTAPSPRDRGREAG